MPGLFIAMILMLLAPAFDSTPAPAAAAPVASPTATDFPFIGRVRSKRFCDLELARTNGAITVALTNDRVIAVGIARLRAADLDRMDLTIVNREKVMHDLRSVAAAIQKNLRAGNAQVTDLRALSVKEPDATRSPELKLLADQLDDAYERQFSVGSDLAKMLTIVDGRFARAQGELLAAGVMPETQQEHATNGIVSIDQRAAYEPLNSLFSEVADDFSERTEHIGKAEAAAAVHVPKAVGGC